MPDTTPTVTLWRLHWMIAPDAPPGESIVVDHDDVLIAADDVHHWTDAVRARAADEAHRRGVPMAYSINVAAPYDDDGRSCWRWGAHRVTGTAEARRRYPFEAIAHGTMSR